MTSARGGRPLGEPDCQVGEAGAPRQHAPRRHAHLWTAANGIVTVRVDAFPLAIRCGAVVYECSLDSRGWPLVRPGPRSGVEFVEYRKRRPIDAAALAPQGDALIITEEELLGIRTHARATR